MHEERSAARRPEPDLAAFLREVDIFQNLGTEATTRLVGEAEEASFPVGTKILRRGEPGDRMFVIIEGRARVPVLDKDGRQLLVAELCSGDIFGEMALLTGEPRTADVEALTDCRCLVLFRAAVEGLIRQHTEVAQLLTTLVGERLLSSDSMRQVGKYELLGEIGRGSNSIVYEGLHPELERPVAIKMLSHRKVYHPRFNHQFQNEARIIGRLRHPNIVEVYDTERAYHTLFIIMERLRGQPLDVKLRESGAPPPRQTREILRQLASALDLAHAHGIVHRDLKPSNVMLSPEGMVKLMDFGLALDVDGPTLDEPVAGTPRFMAPEQIRGQRVDARSDIYSLGLLAYALLTGQVPFDGTLAEVLVHHQATPVPSPQARNPEVPGDLESFVHRAAAKDPEDRFQSCKEILDHLNEPEGTTGSLDQLAIKTLTFVYSSDQEAVVEEVIEACRQRVAKMPDVEVR